MYDTRIGNSKMNIATTWRLVSAVTCIAATAAATTVACGNNDTPQPIADAGTGTDATVTPDAAKPDATPADTGPKFDGNNPGSGRIVINEISAGDEWIEIVNSGTASFDLEGYRIADRDKVTGAPKVTESVRFPKGTVLAVGAYLLVRGGGAGGDPLGNVDAGFDAGDGGAKPCPSGGQAYCFNAAFGVSNKNGETIYLLKPDLNVETSVDYPPLAAAGTMTYSRFPSGNPTAAFKPLLASPGAANVE
jgi:hypothetical protein